MSKTHAKLKRFYHSAAARFMGSKIGIMSFSFLRSFCFAKRTLYKSCIRKPEDVGISEQLRQNIFLSY